MSNQDNNNNQVPSWATKQPEVEYRTVFNEQIGQLDDEVSALLNDGWQPAGPQYYAEKKGWFVQSMVKVPRQMMPQPR